ncbi:ubiquinol-cytochrome c reductase iron-sulfur subunit [Nitrospira moscoviensis]|uniref:Putative quinol-cytochrome c reductase, iron sulfur subunit n=1 Tax=Nitrospira moscoviensis TaxID=42253 RepID=A0A0K2GAT1_NITMO|nr:Rieske (2Fe-2S) protein [Nitrospira moscoviensis]ALA57707.1 putative quinol-cytochrome c reductase, iron sulfur subunit [Nitrospira moscoviensis]
MAVIHDDVGRRRFLSQAVMGLGVLFGLGTLGLRFLQFLVPPRRERQAEAVLIGAESRIQLGDAVSMDLGGHKILVLKTEQGVAAFSRRCTDLGCLVSWSKEREQFLCPCHQGVYDKTGLNIAGPPPRPLDRFEIVKRGEQLYVNIDRA